MQSFYHSFFDWARRTTTSFGELIAVRTSRHDDEDDDEPMLYRLKHWPDLPSSARTATVLRTLSVMSHRNVNRRWIASTSKLSSAHVDSLLRMLARQDALHTTDITRFYGAPAANALASGAATRA